MSLLGKPLFWVLIVCLIGLVASTLFSLHYGSLMYFHVEQRESNRRRRFIFRVLMFVFCMGIAGALTDLVFPNMIDRVVSVRSAPTLTPARNSRPISMSTVQPDPSDTPLATNIEPTAISTVSGETSNQGKTLIGNTGGSGVNVREQPGLEGSVIERVRDGIPVTKMGESRMVDGFYWQLVQLQDGRDGWIAEDFLVMEE